VYVLFSVIVPVYQQWNLAPALVACLEAQTLPAEEFEVLLVDNGSPDFAPPPSLPANFRVLRCMTPGSYAARNEGARNAGGTWFAFTDGDCRPAPDWLANLKQAISDISDDRTLLAGAVEIVPSSARPNPYEIYDIVGGIPQARYVGRGYGATANLAVSRQTFEAVAGFDARRLSGGDAEFCRRAGARGHPIAYVPTAVVDHPARSTWHELATKARRVKGGQLMFGPLKRRIMWAAATFVSPLRNGVHLMAATRRPLRYRMIAVVVMLGLWGVEIGEIVRLGLGGKPVRT
jgi:glycosyltransferase involved in cell wall biosynthesis